MSNKIWDEAKTSINVDNLMMGPYFSYQAFYTPRHLLFTLSRYKFVAKMLPEDEKIKVLELGCSEGLGTLMLAENAGHVTGVDFDADAISYAQDVLTQYDRCNVSFVHSNFLGEFFGNFRSVISLDVIEHISQSDEDKFMQTICDNLAEDGFCCIGTPNITASQYASEPSKKGHVNLFDAPRLKRLLGQYFENVFLFGMNDEVVHTGFYPMSHYLMALACGKLKNARNR